MVYFDNAATTRVDPEVLGAMLPFLQDEFGNPSSVYGLAGRSSGAIDRAREHVASFVGATPREIVFTGSGSEADNYAIKGTAWALADKGRHLITSGIEHHAVLDTCLALQKQGFEVTVLKTDAYGLIDVGAVRDAMRDDTILVSIMHANNEVGTVEPVAEIGALCRERGIVFHTDAVQSVGKIPVNVDELNVDLMAMSAHKIYGPKGVGALYVRKGTKLTKLIDGGGQEMGRRAGTENVAGIVGMGKAVELLAQRGEEDNKRISRLCERVIEGVLAGVPHVQLTGHPEQRLPNIASLVVNYIEGEGMLLSLDLYWHLRVKRLGVHVGFSGPIPRAACHGLFPRRRPRLPADQPLPTQYRRRGRHPAQRPARLRGPLAGHVTHVGRRAGQGARVRVRVGTIRGSQSQPGRSGGADPHDRHLTAHR